jgi:GT2 family glycosyltransferase
MNNDVEVTHPGWLTNLVDAAYSATHVCGSGGLIFDANGAVSEAGAEIYATGLGKNLYRGASEVSGAANAIRSVGFVSGCLMYMRRDAIEKIGALDDDYHPMYFEDVAWHYSAHIAGLKTIYTPWSRVIHKEGSTAGQNLNSGMKRFQEINRKKFLDKFAGVDVERFNVDT